MATFFSLPIELRLMIFKYVLFWKLFSSLAPWTIPLQLIGLRVNAPYAVCKEFYANCKIILEESTIVSLGYLRVHNDFAKKRMTPFKSPFKIASHLRNIRFGIASHHFEKVGSIIKRMPVDLRENIQMIGLTLISDDYDIKYSRVSAHDRALDLFNLRQLSYCIAKIIWCFSSLQDLTLVQEYCERWEWIVKTFHGPKKLVHSLRHELYNNLVELQIKEPSLVNIGKLKWGDVKYPKVCRRYQGNPSFDHVNKEDRNHPDFIEMSVNKEPFYTGFTQTIFKCFGALGPNLRPAKASRYVRVWYGMHG